jgi:ketosteroid isomerase-like protein
MVHRRSRGEREWCTGASTRRVQIGGEKTMADHPNVALIREALEAFAVDEIKGFKQYVADDIVWHYIGEDEPLRGKEAMVGPAAMDSRDFTIDVEIHDVLANDDHGVAMINATAKRNGQTLKYQTVEILHLKSGKVTERWAFSDDTARITAFFA